MIDVRVYHIWEHLLQCGIMDQDFRLKQLRKVENSQNALALGLVLFLILSIVLLMPIQPNDYWWYMRIASETANTGTIPHTEILSFSQFGQAAVYQHWLSGMLFWWTYKLGGLTLAGLLRGLSIGLFYTCLWTLLRKQGASRLMSCLILLLAALAGSNNWAMRPQVLVYPLFGLTVWLLYAWQEKESRLIWLLPAITLVWTNLHSSFICLFLLAGAAVLFGKGNRRMLIQIIGVSLIGSLLSPYGIGSWQNALAIARSSSVSQFASEWQPPTNSGWQQNLFFLWLLVFPLMAGISSRKLSAVEWVWFLGFGWLALTGLRHGIWFTFLLAVFSAKLTGGLPVLRTRVTFTLANQSINWILAGFLILSPFALLPGLRQSWWKQSPPDLTANTPVDAAAWLKTQPDLPGQLWSDLAYSSYLSYVLPEREVWVYTRMEQFPADQWQEYKDISDGKPGWESVLGKG